MNTEHVMYLTEWAARWGATFQPVGEVGFGRECVGILHGTSYIDYSNLWEVAPGTEFWTPEDAYHKHECLAVLGRGDDAIGQLYAWVKWIDEHGWTVATEGRTPANDIDALFNGLTVTRLIPPADRENADV